MWLTVALTLLTLWFYFYTWRHHRRLRMTILSRHGIPGPEPHVISGNLHAYLQTSNVTWDTNLSNTYGPISGYYLGAKPVVLATDLALLQHIQGSKIGRHYLDRPRRVPGGINADPKRAEMLGNLPVWKWRIVRQILNKGFSFTKLRAMSVDANNLIQVLISRIPEAVGAPKSRPINFYVLYQDLALDLIGKLGFGVDSDIQRNPNDELKAAVEQEFSKSTSSKLLKLSLCFPEIHWLLQPIRVSLEKIKQKMGLGGRSELWDLGLATVSKRQEQIARGESSQNTSDLLSIMISSGKLKRISIVANSVLFFEAGFETLSASLAFITHLLMNHKDAQEIARNEIRELLRETAGEVVNIGILSKFKQLDAIIKEGLRMYPPQTTFIGRSGERDIRHQYTDHDGIQRTCTIPKKVHIQVGLYQILNNDKIWPEPREFRPQRFIDGLTVEQRISYQPFGRGKRVCIGQKYADIILKLVFITLLSRYRIIPATDEQGEIEVVYKTATMTPKNGVMGCVVWDPLFPGIVPRG